MTRLGCGLIALSILASGHAYAETGDRAQAARGMGYAIYVVETHKCDATLTQQAATLKSDIASFYQFTDVVLQSDAQVGKSIRQGRAEARDDAAHPGYKGAFCDRMDEVLSVWRSNVLPSPR